MSFDACSIEAHKNKKVSQAYTDLLAEKLAKTSESSHNTKKSYLQNLTNWYFL